MTRSRRNIAGVNRERQTAGPTSAEVEEMVDIGSALATGKPDGDDEWIVMRLL